ncbi:MAG: asparagine synthetase B, partial [Calditrichaeota bacterium]|nr:asparagine synthetase B [Calditrichota bacterium]
MCGIAGYWQLTGNPDNLAPNAKRMVKAIRHRGPDGEGYHIDSNNGLAMGHARLSIIGLDSGDQPITTAEKDLVLTVNGEFYDYRRLRGLLRTDGYLFNTKSD